MSDVVDPAGTVVVDPGGFALFSPAVDAAAPLGGLFFLERFIPSNAPIGAQIGDVNLDGGAYQWQVPESIHNITGTIAASGSIVSPVIPTWGLENIAVGLTVSQSGTLSVQRYVDTAGSVVQGAPVTLAITGGTAATLNNDDGHAFQSIEVEITNGSASIATIDLFCLLLQSR